MIDSEVMAGLGILQKGQSLLHRPVAPVLLPDERDLVADLLGRLHAIAALARAHHRFTGGMGLAAPQVGVDRAVAIVQRPSAGGFVTLINPVVVAASDVTVEFEGCLSFFDVRGAVPRANRLWVSRQELDGRLVTETFGGLPARLVGHEIDHLAGRLYTDLMEPGAPLLPVAEYRLRRCVELAR